MLDSQMKRGLIENCVLAALAREDSHGYKIVKDLSEFMTLSESTLYPILRRLEGAKLLTAYTVEHNGRLRKVYRITPEGRAHLQSFADDWVEINAMYDYIKGGLER